MSLDIDILDRSDGVRAILDAIEEGVVVTDHEGRCLFLNAAAQRILGTDRLSLSPTEWAAAVGCYHSDMTTPYTAHDLPFVRALRGEGVCEEPIYIDKGQGTDGTWISVSCAALRRGEGDAIGAVTSFRDVTPRQRAVGIIERKLERVGGHTRIPMQKAGCSSCYQYLREVGDRFTLVCRAVEQTADSVVITDRQARIEYVNPAFETTTGYSREEAIGQTPRLLKSGEHDKEFYMKLWADLVAGQPFKGTIHNRKKTGELYWAQQTISPIKDDDGTISHFVSVLKDITELRKREELEFEMRIAREVQQRYYGDTKPAVPGFDVCGGAYPAAEIGGDYYDIVSLPDGCVMLAIGDVSGHGVGSALMMAETRAYVRSFAAMEPDVAEILNRVNQALVGDLDGGRFVTLLLVRLDPRKRSLTYANAGHVPGYSLNGTGEVAWVTESAGMPLGLFRSARYLPSREISLKPGQIMICLTDGVTETKSPDETEFGARRAIDFVGQHRNESAAQIVRGLYSAVCDYSGNQTQKDDITSLICKCDPLA